MNYTFDQLKRQVISLDFSKTDSIKDLNIDSLKDFVDSEIEHTNTELEEEIIKLNNGSVEKFNDLFYIEKPISLNNKLIILNLQLNLLQRIKIDLLKI